MNASLPVQALAGLPVPWEGAKRPPRWWQRDALPLIFAALRGTREQRCRGVVSVTTGGGKSIQLAEVIRLALPGVKARGGVIVVSTPTQNLVKQLAATIVERVGPWDVGVFYGKKKQPEKTVIVTCNPSLATLAGVLAGQGRRVLLLIADECHSSESETMRAAIPLLNPASQVGFTATPFRSVATQALSGWDRLIYRYTFADALRDGVLVPFADHIVRWTGEGIALGTGSASPFSGDTVDDICAEMIRLHGHGPGIVSAMSIDDADAFAEKLQAAGISALSIHSELTDTEQARRIEALRTGELRTLVHVSLLAEGVDLPWLRWLCLRRPVGARVRFVQELGRVLRVCDPDAWGSKAYAIVMDPHDLLGTIGISHDADVGRIMDEEAEKGDAKLRKKDFETAVREMPGPVAVDMATAWARRMLLEVQAHGLAPADHVSAGRWRDQEPSEAQVACLRRISWATRHLPETHREPVKLMVEHGPRLSRGAVSDLISILKAVADAAKPDREARRHWHWPDALQVEEIDEVVFGRLKAQQRTAAKAAKERAA